MSDQFLAEIRLFGGNFAPAGWALCNGQIMPIAQNTALFSILGTFYGGNGTTTFGLPDLQARIPLHADNGAAAPGLTPVDLGEQLGSAAVTLLASEMPSHTHAPAAYSGGGDTDSPASASWAQARLGRVSDQIYATAGGTQPMHEAALASAGGGQPHNNLSPYLVINFIIALQGIYPTRP